MSVFFWGERKGKNMYVCLFVINTKVVLNYDIGIYIQEQIETIETFRNKLKPNLNL